MQILKENVILTRAEWVVKARTILIHGRERRSELVLEKTTPPQQQDIGWSVEDLAVLHNALVEWKKKNGEI